MKEYHNEYADLWHHVPGELEKAGGFWLLRAGRNRAKPHYTAGPKRIEAYGMHVIEEGRIVLADEQQEVELQKGDLFCLFPGIAYTYRKAAPEGELRMVWLTLSGPQLEPLLTGLGVTRESPYLRSALHPQAWFMLRKIEGAIWGKDQPERENPLARIGLLYQWFAQLADKKPETVPGNPDKDGPDAWLSHAVSFFKLHYMEPQLRVEAVAGLVGIHRSHFTQTFAERIGVPPQQFLVDLRMRRAEQLLRLAHLQIGEVALSVGYSDVYTFSRAFKKRYGVPPLQYRSRIESGRQ